MGNWYLTPRRHWKRQFPSTEPPSSSGTQGPRGVHSCLQTQEGTTKPTPNKTVSQHPTVAASLSEEYVSAWCGFFVWFLPPFFLDWIIRKINFLTCCISNQYLREKSSKPEHLSAFLPCPSPVYSRQHISCTHTRINYPLCCKHSADSIIHCQ